MKTSDSYFSMEVFMMGGASIITSVALWATMGKSASLFAVSQIAFSLAFVANHPHFLSSYILLYGDFRSQIFKRPRYFWSAVVVPLILGGSLVVAMCTANQRLMAHVITSMFFFVGWHYVKQVFGCVIVTSAQRKIFYSQFERRLLLTNLVATWFMSWLTNQVRYGDGGADPNAAFAFYGISHYRLNLPPWLLSATYAVLGVTLAGVLFMQFKRYKAGIKPPPPAVAAFFALYAWYLPSLIHPAYAYFIPLFHSMQYMAFVWVLKRNQVSHEISHLTGQPRLRGWINKFVSWFLLAAVLGALTFEFIPKTLDAQGFVTGLGTTPFLAAFLLFINIHHYFIDNVIWRSDNPTVKQFLFSSPAPAPADVMVKRAA